VVTPTSKMVTLGEQAEFDCSVVHPVWSHNNEPIVQNNILTRDKRIVIDAVKIRDLGCYTCEGRNSLNEVVQGYSILSLGIGE